MHALALAASKRTFPDAISARSVANSVLSRCSDAWHVGHVRHAAARDVQLAQHVHKLGEERVEVARRGVAAAATAARDDEQRDG